MLGFNVPFDTLQIILETILIADHLIGAKTQSHREPFGWYQ